MNFNDLLVPLLPTTERYWTCINDVCYIEPFSFATTPIYWIGWGIVIGCILISGKRKTSSESSSNPKSAGRDSKKPKDDREPWEIELARLK